MYPGSLKQNRMFRLSEDTGLSMEKIHHQFFNSSMVRELMETGSVLNAVKSSSSSENSSSSVIWCSMLSATLFVLACRLAEVSVTLALC